MSRDLQTLAVARQLVALLIFGAVELLLYSGLWLTGWAPGLAQALVHILGMWIAGGAQIEAFLGGHNAKLAERVAYFVSGFVATRAIWEDDWSVMWLVILSVAFGHFRGPWREISAVSPPKRFKAIWRQTYKSAFASLLLNIVFVPAYNLLAITLDYCLGIEIGYATRTCFCAGFLLGFGWWLSLGIAKVILSEPHKLGLGMHVWSLKSGTDYSRQLSAKDLHATAGNKKRRKFVFAGGKGAELFQNLESRLKKQTKLLKTACKNMPPIRSIADAKLAPLCVRIWDRMRGRSDFRELRAGAVVSRPQCTAAEATAFATLLSKSITDDPTGSVQKFLRPGIKAIFDLAKAFKKYKSHDGFPTLHDLSPGELPADLAVFEKRLNTAKKELKRTFADYANELDLPQLAG